MRGTEDSGGDGERGNVEERVGERKALTFALARFPIPRYTRLSRRCTSVRIILSSSLLSSVSSVSILLNAALYCSPSSCLYAWMRRTNRDRKDGGTYNPINRVSRLCLRNIRFSCFAQAMFWVRTSIWIGWLSGMELKKSRSVLTVESVESVRRGGGEGGWGRTELRGFSFCGRGRHVSPRLRKDFCYAFRIPTCNQSLIRIQKGSVSALFTHF